jgi:hypothetical protein
MRDMIRMILLVEGDDHLGPLEPCQGSEGVDDIHLLLNDAALPAGFVCLGAPKIMRQCLALGNSLSSS